MNTSNFLIEGIELVILMCVYIYVLMQDTAPFPELLAVFIRAPNHFLELFISTTQPMIVQIKTGT